MIVAITGGSGFIGRRLLMRHLALGDEVRVLSRRKPAHGSQFERVCWFEADLGAGGDFHNFVDDADVLYHCAGEVRDQALMPAVHVDGTRRLVEAASGRIGRWVQLSSTGAYGPRRDGLITEQTELKPQGTYEETKVASDLLVAEASRKGAFQHVILRPSIVYGATMPNRSLYGLISMVDRGLFFFIGRPGASANYVHVDNVVEALMLCGKLPQASGEVYNLSDHRTMEQFVAAIAGLLGCSVPRLRAPELPVRALAMLFGSFNRFPLTSSRVDALTGRAIYSSRKIEQELGYRHPLTMEAGLADLVQFWRDCIDSHRSAAKDQG